MIEYKYDEVAGIEERGLSFTNLELALLKRLSMTNCSYIDCSHCDLRLENTINGYRCLANIIRKLPKVGEPDD